MFCSECGAEASGKFCSSCGHRLQPGDSQQAEAIHLPTDWSNIIDYETLVHIPEVRNRISDSAAQAKNPLTGEEFLEMYFKAIGKIAGLPIPIPVTGLARFAQSTYSKFGIRTGKSRSEFISKPPGSVLVSILCSLARKGRTLRGAQQLSDGCILVASLPSDMFALEGDLVITVTRSLAGSMVEAKTEIKGQLFDWGKSHRCLDELFAELSSAIAA